MVAKKKTEDIEINVLDITQGSSVFIVVGKKPMIFNSVSVKSQRELLFPQGRKTAADRAGSLKHDPRSEFRNALYKHMGDDHPTRCYFPATAFKGVLGTAALDLPGTKKTEIGRLSWVEGEIIDIWGIPKLLMSVVRSADIAKTPDIRTRAIMQEWCAVVEVSFVKPKLTEHNMTKLMAAGGITVGVGDFRQEKGRASYGQFRLAELDDEVYRRLLETAGREAQDEAIAAAEPYDSMSYDLSTWFYEELERRRGKAKAKKVDKDDLNEEIAADVAEAFPNVVPEDDMPPPPKKRRGNSRRAEA
jgi:hypothetical protein